MEAFDAEAMESLLAKTLVDRRYLCHPMSLHVGFYQCRRSKSLDERRQVLQLYTRYCDLNALDEEGGHILHFASSDDEYAMLLSLGANPFAKTFHHNGWSYIAHQADLSAQVKELFTEAQDRLLFPTAYQQDATECHLCKRKILRRPVTWKGNVCHVDCVAKQGHDKKELE